MNKFLNSSILKVILRYICIGLVAATIEFVIFIFFIKYLYFVVANSLSYLCGMVLSFVLNLIFNFRIKDKKVIRFSKFFVVNIFGITFSNIFLFFLSYYIHTIEITKIISILIVTSLQFLANYFWTFKKYK